MSVMVIRLLSVAICGRSDVACCCRGAGEPDPPADHARPPTTGFAPDDSGGVNRGQGATDGYDNRVRARVPSVTWACGSHVQAGQQSTPSTAVAIVAAPIRSPGSGQSSQLQPPWRLWQLSAAERPYAKPEGERMRRNPTRAASSSIAMPEPRLGAGAEPDTSPSCLRWDNGHLPGGRRAHRIAATQWSHQRMADSIEPQTGRFSRRHGRMR